MKKQKFMKLSAFTSDPDLGNSFTAPVSHNGEISVVFRGKDVSIHGWDGSAWTTIYTWNSLDKQFTFDNTYQNYFLKSLTGSEESIGVSFFSTSRYAGSTPSLAGIDRDVKLYDIDEVPIYTASDEGKFLTIMSDGSLAWLLANESYIVESEGGPSGIPNVSGGLETLGTNTLYGNAEVTSQEGLLTSNVGDYAVATSNYHNGATEQTISVWIKPSVVTSDWSTVALTRNWNGSSNGFAMHIKSNQIRITGPQSSNPVLDRNYTFQSDTWYKLNLVWTATSIKVFVNGVQVGSTTASGQITGGVSNLHFGSGVGGANSYKGNILGVAIENVAKSEGEILSSYEAEKPEEAGQPVNDAPAAPAGPQANFLEEMEGRNFPNGIYTDNSSGQGHKLRFNLDGDNIISYGNDGEPVEEEFTISWWMNLNTAQDANTVSLLGNYALPNRFALKVGGNLTGNAHITTQIKQNTMFNSNTGLSIAGEWVHGAYTCKSNGSNLIVSLYINGTKLPGTRSYPLGTKLLPSTSNDEFSFGGNGMSGASAKGQFDSIQIEEGIALTDEQVAAIAAQADRQMGIEAASQV